MASGIWFLVPGIGLTAYFSLVPGVDHLLKLGAGFRRFATDYGYRREREFDTPLALLLPEPREGLFEYADRLEDEQLHPCEAGIFDRRTYFADHPRQLHYGSWRAAPACAGSGTST